MVNPPSAKNAPHISWPKKCRRILRDHLKRWIYRTGLLSAYNKILNRDHLTVVMFHRVLPRRPEQPDPHDAYTLNEDIFDSCIGFFRRHYSVVSLDQICAAQGNGPKLPRRPLLITLDDGWSDTFSHAAKILMRHGTPAVCFIVSDAIEGSDDAWLMPFEAAWRKSSVSVEAVTQTSRGGHYEPPNSVAKPPPHLAALARVAALPAETRAAFLSGWREAMEPDDRMMTADEVAQLPGLGIAVGAHGATHAPLTMVRSLRDELQRAAGRLDDLVAPTSQARVTALSIPHGRYDAEVLETARRCGFKFVFTSDPQLEPLRQGQMISNVCGRIEIATRHAAANGIFRPDLLALHLFRARRNCGSDAAAQSPTTGVIASPECSPGATPTF